MAAPSYSEDLTDLNLAETDTGWLELTGTIGGEAYSAQGPTAGADGDYPFIQGEFAVTQDCTKNTAVGSLAYNNGTGTGGHGTDGAYFVWQNYMVASNIGTYAQGGFQVCVGSGAGDFDAWYVGGVDKAPYPYGGWVNHAVNTTVTPDGTAGTPSGTEQYIGAAVFVITGSSKGEVHNVDVIRYGRGSAIFEFGDLANGYATFAGFAALNDNNSNRWGLISDTSGGYLWKGRMALGTATNAVDFRDANRTVFIQWTPKVTANFNLIEVTNASSNVLFDTISFICLDTTTASRGRFLMTDNATVALTDCNFVDMDTFVLQSNATASGTTFRRCNLVTQGGATISECIFANSTSSTAALLTTPSTISSVTDNTFIRTSGTTNAVDLGDLDGSVTSIDWDGNRLTGYGSQTAGNGISSTANGAIALNFLSNFTFTITVVNGATVPTVEISGTGTVNIVAAVTVNINGLKDLSEVRVFTAGTTTELNGVESVSGGVGTGVSNGSVSGSTDDNTFSFSSSAGANLDIRIFNINYDSTQILNFTVSANGDNIEAVQVEDRVFSNP